MLGQHRLLRANSRTPTCQLTTSAYAAAAGSVRRLSFTTHEQNSGLPLPPGEADLGRRAPVPGSRHAVRQPRRTASRRSDRSASGRKRDAEQLELGLVPACSKSKAEAGRR